MSSTMSSSVHFRPARFFAKGRRWATSIAGRLACGAFETRFCRYCEYRCKRLSSRTYPESCDDHPNDLLLRCTLSDIDESGYNIEASSKAVSMGSYYGKAVLYFWICSATSCSNVSSHRQKPTW